MDLEGAQHVEHAVPLEAAFAAEIGRALAQDAFDAPRLADQLGVARQEHRRGAADMRRRHAGADRDRPSPVPATAHWMRSPGATRSGFSRPSPVGPRLEKKLTP